jgi:hypothetical protein
MPAGYVSTHVLLGTSPAGMTVPRMGLHWLDSKSPELPPAHRPFTATFIVGSWNGQVIFDEPMVTRDFILAQRTGPATADSIALPLASAMCRRAITRWAMRCAGTPRLASTGSRSRV